MPVVGGNVSLYNESPDGPILPTPVIGMVGKLPDARRAGRLGFARRGRRDRAGRRASTRRATARSSPSSTAARPLGRCLPRTSPAIRDGARAGPRRASATRRFTSAHDIAEGGIAVALAECCIAGRHRRDRSTLPDGLDPFGEDFGTGVHRLAARPRRSTGLPIDRRGRRRRAGRSTACLTSQFPSSTDAHCERPVRTARLS